MTIYLCVIIVYAAVDAKMALLLSQLYCSYIKYMIKFIHKSKVLSIRITDVTKLVKKLKTKDIFAHYENFDAIISQIMQIFENTDFCRKTRLFQNFIYMIFLDMVKIYNVFYIMTMETLDRFKKMSASEMSKAMVMYKNFVSFTETLKKEANTIPMLFGFTFKEPNYYKPDPNKERAMSRALKDKESGGDAYDNDDSVGGEAAPEFEEVRQKYDEDEKDSDDGNNSDEDYQFDLLSDVKKQEQMASVHGGPKRGQTTVQKKQKIKVDDFNTAALDDLLGGSEPIPRSETVKVAHIEVDEEQVQDEAEAEAEEWDPFSNKEENVYSAPQMAQVPVSNPKKTESASANIFGDDDDMWGATGPATSQKQQSIKEQRQTLDDILGGDDTDHFAMPANKQRSQTMAPSSNDFDMLKNLYNTSSVAPSQPMYNQQDYYNTGMGGAGYGGMDYNTGMGYNNQGYGGGMSYGAQPQYYNTGMAGIGGMGYNNQSYGYGGQQNYATGYNMNQNYNYGGQASSGLNTTAPSGQANKGGMF